MNDQNLQAAVSAGVMSAESEHRALLQSIVEVARAIFSARAASIFLHNEEEDELVFEAVAGEGADSLVGKRFPSDTGVAGWVLVTRQAIVVEDLTADTRFSREAAESTGFVPKGLMAVPLLAEEKTLGVLEVLDRPQDTKFTLAEMDVLGLSLVTVGAKASVETQRLFEGGEYTRYLYLHGLSVETAEALAE